MKKNKILSVLIAVMFTLIVAVPVFGTTAPTAFLNPFTSTNVTIVNNYTSPAAITIAKEALTTLNAGDVIKVTKGTTNVLSTDGYTVSTTDAAITLTTKESLGGKTGKLSFTVTPKDTVKYKVSAKVDITYAAQKTPTLGKADLAALCYSDQDDVLTVTSSSAIIVGDTIKVYAKDEVASTTNKVLATAKTTVAGIAVVKLGKAVTTPNAIYVTITRKDCTESDRVQIDASAVTAATKTPTTSVKAFAVPGGLLVSGIALTTAKTSYNVMAYTADPSAYLTKTISKESKDALALIQLGKTTTLQANKGSYVFIAFKNTKFSTDITADKVYVVLKYTGETKDKCQAYSVPVEVTVTK